MFQEIENLDGLSELLNRSETMTHNMLGILNSFESRLRKLEETIIPIYKETGNLQKRHESILFYWSIYLIFAINTWVITVNLKNGCVSQVVKFCKAGERCGKYVIFNAPLDTYCVGFYVPMEKWKILTYVVAFLLSS